MRHTKEGCNCGERRHANTSRDGVPIATWRCPIHGNIFAEAALAANLTGMQLEILEFIQRRHSVGQPAGVEEVSEHFGYGLGSVRVQFSVLQSLNLIERA